MLLIFFQNVENLIKKKWRKIFGVSHNCTGSGKFSVLLREYSELAVNVLKTLVLKN